MMTMMEGKTAMNNNKYLERKSVFSVTRCKKVMTIIVLVLLAVSVYAQEAPYTNNEMNLPNTEFNVMMYETEARIFENHQLDRLRELEKKVEERYERIEGVIKLETKQDTGGL